MSDFRRRFDPSELGGGEDAELAGIFATARDLESFAATETLAPTAGFEDRVMAAIAGEPRPGVIVAGGFMATLRQAWRTASSGGRPLVLRGQAFALLLIVALAVGSLGSVAVIGSARLLLPDGLPPPTVLSSPPPSLNESTPSPSPSRSPSPSPSPTVTPSPTETVEPSGTDDHGGSSGSGSGNGSGSGSSSGGDDSSGSGGTSGGDEETSEPTDESSGPGSGDDETSDSSGSGSGSDSDGSS